MAHLSSRQLGNGVAPVKLEDRFDNLKEDSEEEKQQNSSLVISHAENGREVSFDEDPLKHRPNILQLARERKARRLGRYGLAAEALSMIHDPKQRPQPYSLSLLAAISQQAVVGAQVIEGGVDASVFENFLKQVILGLKTQGWCYSSTTPAFTITAGSSPRLKRRGRMSSLTLSTAHGSTPLRHCSVT